MSGCTDQEQNLGYEDGLRNKRGKLGFLAMILGITALVIIPRSCADTPKYLENKAATVGILLTMQAGNGVLIPYRNSVYVLTAAHLCNVDILLSILSSDLEARPELEDQINKQIELLTRLTTEKKLCSGSVLVDEIKIKSTVLAVDFTKDLMLLKLDTKIALNTVTLQNDDNLTLGQPIYFIGGLYQLGWQTSIEYGKTGFYLTLSLASERGVNKYMQTSLHSSPGYSGSGVYDELTGNLIGIVSAGLSDTNNDTLVVPISSVNQFLSAIPEEATTKNIYCTGTTAQCLALTAEKYYF